MNFTQSATQNPASADISAHVSFKVLQLSEKYGFYIVEDDIFCDLQAKHTPRLAALDQLDRGYLRAQLFEKTLSGSLRVGFIACSQQLANDFAEMKMLTSITSPQVTERLIHGMLVDGHYRKYVGRLRERLDASRPNVLRAFERVGLEVFVEPQAGMFVWAHFPKIDDSIGANRARDERRHHARSGRCLPPPFGAFAVDTIQRRGAR